MTNCTYILPTKYDILVRQAYDLVDNYIDTELDTVHNYGKLGVPQDDKLNSIRNYYHLINYLVYIRQKIDQYILDKGLGCITTTEIQSFKDFYKTDCIIKYKVCEQYTNNIVNLFFKLPTCDSTPIYTWTTNDTCIEIDETQYAIGLTLEKRLNNIVVETFYIEPNADSKDIQEATGVDSTTADQLVTDRLSFPGSNFCCGDPIFNAPIVTINNVTESTIDIEWESNAEEFTVTVIEGNGTETIVVEEVTEKTLSIEGLDSNTIYTVRVTALSCAGDNSTDLEITTGPFTVTLILDESIKDQINITGVTTFQDVLYNENYELTWTDSTEPFFIVNSVLVDGVERYDEVATSTTPPSDPVGNPANILASGNITIPNIIKDITVILSGIPGNICTTIQLLSTGNNTFELDFVDL